MYLCHAHLKYGVTMALMAEYLGFEFADAKDWLFFGYDGKVDFHKTNDALRKIISETPKVVIPGFYGAMPDGSIRTFSRGGSDITGTIGAGAYENWTNVSGILMADPRIVSNPKSIEKITYAELREMSYMGAEVLRRSGAQGRGDKRCTDSRTAHINFAQVTLSLGRFCRKKPGLIRGRGPLCLIRL